MAEKERGEEVARVTVRVKKSTLDAVDEYILAVGAYRTYFLSMALVIGCRALMDMFGPARPGEDLKTMAGVSRTQMESMTRHESVGGAPGPFVPQERSRNRFAALEAELAAAGLVSAPGPVEDDDLPPTAELEHLVLEQQVNDSLSEWGVIEGEFREKD